MSLLTFDELWEKLRTGDEPEAANAERARIGNLLCAGRAFPRFPPRFGQDKLPR